MSIPSSFLKDMLVYCMKIYPYEIVGHSFGVDMSFIIEFRTPPCNDIRVKYLPSAAIEEIFSLWQNGELNKERNQPMWQIEFENYMEGT